MDDDEKYNLTREMIRFYLPIFLIPLVKKFINLLFHSHLNPAKIDYTGPIDLGLADAVIELFPGLISRFVGLFFSEILFFGMKMCLHLFCEASIF